MSTTEPITAQVRDETMAKLAKAQERFALDMALIECLDGHHITHTDNLGYYRSQVHCACAAEWWAGEHEGDPSFENMWNLHRAEVVSAFLADRAACAVSSPSGLTEDGGHLWWSGHRVGCSHDATEDGVKPVTSAPTEDDREELRAAIEAEVRASGLDPDGPPYSTDGESQWPTAREEQQHG